MTRRENDVPAKAAQPILDFQRRWVEALISADTAVLDAILADTYVDTDESGSRTNASSYRRAADVSSTWRLAASPR